MDRRGRPVLDGDLVPDSRARTGTLAGADPGTQFLVAASLLILAGLAWACTEARGVRPPVRPGRAQAGDDLGTGPLSFDHAGRNACCARLDFQGP